VKCAIKIDDIFGEPALLEGEDRERYMRLVALDRYERYSLTEGGVDERPIGFAAWIERDEKGRRENVFARTNPS
jgi:hypothetical protein